MSKEKRKQVSIFISGNETDVEHWVNEFDEDILEIQYQMTGDGQGYIKHSVCITYEK